jgi:hypothetical protein
MDNETTPDVPFRQSHVYDSPAPGSDNDPTDSDSPGVFFGSFQSPEKKFLPKVAHRLGLDPGGLGSPFRRRSPGLSPSPLRNFAESDQDEDGVRSDSDEGDEGSARSATPENDRYAQDGEFFVQIIQNTLIMKHVHYISSRTIFCVSE